MKYQLTEETKEFLEWANRRKQDENIPFSTTVLELGWTNEGMTRVRAGKWCVPKWVYMKYREIAGLDRAGIAIEALEQIRNYSDGGDYARAIVGMKRIADEALIKIKP